VARGRRGRLFLSAGAKGSSSQWSCAMTASLLCGLVELGSRNVALALVVRPGGRACVVASVQGASGVICRG